MNQIIKDVLEERAGQAQAPHVDAARLIRAGRRRSYARRGAGTIAVAALAATAVVVVPSVIDRSGSEGGGPEPAVNPQPDLSGAWADADYLYYGTAATPRPHDLNDLTNVEDGAIYSTWDGTEPTGAFYGWWPEGGAPGGDFPSGEEPGRILTENVRPSDIVRRPMVEDDMVAWFEADGPDRVRLAMDVAGTEYSSVGVSARSRWDSDPLLRALDEGGDGDRPVVIYANRGEVWSWDGRSSPQRLEMSEAEFVDRDHGVTAVTDTVGDQPGTLTFLDSDGDEIGRVEGLWGGGKLSDSGKQFLGRNDDGPVVVDNSSGRKTPLDLDDSEALQMAWDPEGNVTVATRPGDDENAPVDLFTCSASDGACSLIASDVGDYSEIVLPDQTFAGL